MSKLQKTNGHGSVNSNQLHSTININAMITPPHACNRIFRSRLSSSYGESIWISDDLLSEALHRFTYTQRRHGSSVPGPLEARKRATKRKNTSLASVAGNGAPFDVGVLLGPGKQQPWWNNAQQQNPNKCEFIHQWSLNIANHSR